MDVGRERSEPTSPGNPTENPASASPATFASLAFGAGALGSFASLVALGGVGVPWAWLLLSVLVLGGSAFALVTGRTQVRPGALALGWLAVPALLFALFAWWDGALFDVFHSSTFDRAAWIEAEGGGHGDRTRVRMVKDLRQSGRLEGLTRAEALRLLGRHDGRWRGDERAWVWRIGPAGIDNQWLALHFGPDERVESHRIVED